MSPKQKNAGAGEKSSNRPDTDMLILEIERNRFQMQLAWHRAAVLNCPIQTLEQALEKPETRQSARRKKSR